MKKVAGILTLIFLPALVAACPMCTEAATAGDAGLRKGIGITIFLMLGVTFTLAVFVISMIVIEGRKFAAKPLPENN